MFLITFTAVCWIPPILGFGAILRYGGDTELRPAVSGMLGLGALACLGTILNFVVPLSPAISVAAWAAGFGAFLWQRRWLFSSWSPWDGILVAVVLFALVLLMQPPTYDAGLYYLQSVKWAAERRIELGLGNLHSRLAMNSAWFVVSAMVELPFAAERSTFFVNLLPPVFGAAAAAVGLRRFLEGDRSMSSPLLMGVLLPIGAGVWWVGSQGPDQPLAILTLVALALLARSLEPGANFAADARAATLIAALCVLVKVSGAPLFVGAVVVALLRRAALPAGWITRTALLLTLAFVPWVARSVLLSGCMVMPATATCIPGLPWGMSPSDVQGLSDAITSWARAPGMDPPHALGSWSWLPAWAERAWANPTVRVVVALSAAGLAGWATRIHETTASLAIPYAIAVGGVASWFFLAPNLRFGLGYLLALGVLPLAFAVSHPRLASWTGMRAAVVAATLAVSVHLVNVSDAPRLALRKMIAIPADGWPSLPGAPTVVRTTDSGYVVRVPLQGDRCFAAPIPCTPLFEPRLARDWALHRSRTEAAASPR